MEMGIVVKIHVPIQVQLMIQKILDVTGKHCSVLWYMGAQILLITNQYMY
jgi:hypothetical protein